MSREPAPIVEQGVIAGNYSGKYETRNPLARRMVAGFDAAVLGLAEGTGARDIHEIGCGEGHLTRMFARLPGRSVRGSDFSEQVLAVARERLRGEGLDIPLKARSIYDLDPAQDAAELVACCEVLEHLERPDDGLAMLASLARPWLLVSVPREPLWRVLNMARGKYLGDWGNTPGHLQHWSRTAFLDFLRRRVEVVETRSPVPWTVALCRARPAR